MLRSRVVLVALSLAVVAGCAGPGAMTCADWLQLSASEREATFHEAVRDRGIRMTGPQWQGEMSVALAWDYCTSSRSRTLDDALDFVGIPQGQPGGFPIPIQFLLGLLGVGVILLGHVWGRLRVGELGPLSSPKQEFQLEVDHPPDAVLDKMREMLWGGTQRGWRFQDFDPSKGSRGSTLLVARDPTATDFGYFAFLRARPHTPGRIIVGVRSKISPAFFPDQDEVLTSLEDVVDRADRSLPPTPDEASADVGAASRTNRDPSIDADTSTTRYRALVFTLSLLDASDGDLVGAAQEAGLDRLDFVEELVDRGLVRMTSWDRAILTSVGRRCLEGGREIPPRMSDVPGGGSLAAETQANHDAELVWDDENGCWTSKIGGSIVSWDDQRFQIEHPTGLVEEVGLTGVEHVLVTQHYPGASLRFVTSDGSERGVNCERGAFRQATRVAAAIEELLAVRGESTLRASLPSMTPARGPLLADSTVEGAATAVAPSAGPQATPVDTAGEPPASSRGESDLVAQLAALAQLHRDGALDEEEYRLAKHRMLGL